MKMKKHNQEQEKLGDVPQNAINHANKRMSEIDPLIPEASAMDMVVIGLGWVAVGFMLINLEIPAVPWISILGWPVMGIGALTVVLGYFANKRKK